MVDSWGKVPHSRHMTATTADKATATIDYFTRKGWEQSHSVLPGGLIFEHDEDGQLKILATTHAGVELALVKLTGRYRCELANRVVNGLAHELSA